MTLGIQRFIESALIRREEVREPQWKRGARLAAEISGVVVAAMARMGIAEVTLKAGGESRLYGGLLTLGNVGTFGPFCAWATLHMIEELTRSLSPEEKKLFERDFSCVRMSAKVASVIGGFLAQLPIAYAAYHAAEGKSSQLQLTLGVSQELDSGLTVKSLHDSLMKFIDWWGGQETPLRMKLIGEVERARSALLSRGSPGVDTFLLEDLDSLRIARTGGEYFRALRSIGGPARSESSLALRRTQEALKGLSLLMTAAVMFLYYPNATRGAALANPNPAFTSLVGAFVVLVNVYIWHRVIQGSALSTFDWARGALPRSIEARYAPISHAALTALAFGISVLSYGPNPLFAEEYYPRWAVAPLATFSSMATFCMGLFALFTVRDALIRLAIDRSPWVEGRERLQIDRELTRLSRALSRAPEGELETFNAQVEELPSET